MRRALENKMNLGKYNDVLTHPAMFSNSPTALPRYFHCMVLEHMLSISLSVNVELTIGA